MPVDHTHESGAADTSSGRNSGTALACKVCLFREADGGYSVRAAMLPGAISEGDTAEEALNNIRDALAGLVQSYAESGDPIPWTPVEFERAPDAEKWVTIDG